MDEPLVFCSPRDRARKAAAVGKAAFFFVLLRLQVALRPQLHFSAATVVLGDGSSLKLEKIAFSFARAQALKTAKLVFEKFVEERKNLQAGFSDFARQTHNFRNFNFWLSS